MYSLTRTRSSCFRISIGMCGLRSYLVSDFDVTISRALYVVRSFSSLPGYSNIPASSNVSLNGFRSSLNTFVR